MDRTEATNGVSGETHRVDMAHSQSGSTSVESVRVANLQFQLMQSMRVGVPATDFYRTFVGSLMEACAARATCVWQVQGASIAPAFHVGLESCGLVAGSDIWKQHEAFAMGFVARGLTAAVPSGVKTEWGVNPLAAEVLFVPVRQPQKPSQTAIVTALIEVIVATDTSSSELDVNANQRRERSTARLQITQAWAGLFLEHVQVREALARAGQSDSEAALRSFLARLNSVSKFDEVATVAVNDCSAVFGCDRVTFGWRRGGRTDVIAVSGQDRVDSRSPVVQTLKAVANTAVKAKTPFRTTMPLADEATGNQSLLANASSSASSPSARSETNALYAAALKGYPTDQQPKSLVVLPIKGASPDECVGAMILEQFRSDSVPMLPAALVDFVTQQVRSAMERAEVLAAVPMLTFWERRAAGSRVRPSNRALWSFAALAAVAGVGSIPIELRLPATGTLQAESRRIVFAPEDGIVREVLVKQGDSIKPGQELLRLENLELVTLRRELAGQMQQSNERRRAVEARRTSTQSTERDQLESQGQLLEIDAAIQSLARQMELVEERLARLKIVATEAGLVTSNNPEQSLLNRPCRQGEPLLQQINPNGSWRLEVMIVEADAGHMLRRMAEAGRDAPLAVDFVLATESDRRYQGTLREVAPTTEPTPSGTVLRATVDLAPDALPPLRDGAAVTARINCGRHRAAFVWFRELIEVVQRNWWH